jgi:thiol-disulfide isomerase/thioredoxin
VNDDPKAQAAFIAAMKLSPRLELQLFGFGRDQVEKLRSKPMDLQITTMMGEKIDLAKLRGNVVLVDIWSNWCLSCLEAMPRVQAVYDKYRGRGFEVVGVWLTADEAKEKPQALKFLRDKGATWPNGVPTRQTMNDFNEQFGIIGVPVTFLLDQNGLLVTNDVSGPKLELEVKRLLGL